MNILLFDVETAPNLGTIWSLKTGGYIGVHNILETSRVMCYAAKWYGSDEILFDSEYSSDHYDVVRSLWQLLDEADAVVTYNGDRFDRGVINREFLLYGMAPPSPYHSIDLLKVVRKQFKFVSNKLDHIAKELGIGQKEQHEGHELWLKCMNKEAEAWKTMERYNKQDVLLLEDLYDHLLPWIKNHPNHGLYTRSEEMCCPNCGSVHLKKNGIEHTRTLSYQRYRCKGCGCNVKGKSSILTKEKSGVILTQC